MTVIMALNTIYVNIIPLRFQQMGRVAFVSGLLNAIAYLGSALTTFSSGIIVEKWGWDVTVSFWCGMTVNPGYAGQKIIPATLQKIQDCRRYLDAKGRTDIEIEVDGNVSFENAVKMKAKGSNIFVGGSSSIFCTSATVRENILHMRSALAG